MFRATGWDFSLEDPRPPIGTVERMYETLGSGLVHNRLQVGSRPVDRLLRSDSRIVRSALDGGTCTPDSAV